MTCALFITFEGGEGAGKSTQMSRLSAWLQAQGHTPLMTREPGGSEGAERIRSLILDPAAQFDAATLALLFAAARRDHLHRVIRPALDAGKIVLCDRFSDSTRAYQGAAAGVDMAMLDTLDAITVGSTRPDLTLILDLAPEVGMARAAQRRGGAATIDRFEAKALDFHHKVRDGFLAIAREHPERCRIIDAARDADAVFADITTAVTGALAAGASHA